MKNKKKVTLLGVAFIAAVITLAGVGYAVTHDSYEGKTTSYEGAYDVDYIIVSLDVPSYKAPASELKLTWNEVTTLGQGDALVTTFTFQDSDVLEHEVTLAKAAGSDTDEFKLTVTFDGSIATGYTLKYSTNAGSTWTEYGTAISTNGVDIDVGTTTYLWKVVSNSPTTTSNPETTVSIPALVYTVTATQA